MVSVFSTIAFYHEIPQDIFGQDSMNYAKTTHFDILFLM